MPSWAQFAAAAPAIAEAGRALVHQFGPGLVYLATVRPDGGPRLHPVCANFVDGELCLLVIDSPKRRDLLRDGRVALHSFPPQDVDDEFYVTGRAVHREDQALLDAVVAAQHASGATTSGDELLFSISIERVLLARYGPRGTPDAFPPAYTHWPPRRASG